MITDGKTFADAISEQYYLSKYVNISLRESDTLTLFEFEAYVSMVLTDLKNTVENLPRLSK